MCGRYANSRRPEELVSYFQLGAPPSEVLAPSYNIAPTTAVYVVLQGPAQRELRVVRWGLVPSWAKDTTGAARYINARAETVATTPAFRSAYRRRRCLVPADGYYEWQADAGRKQPYFLSALGGAPLAMAGLYEVWTPPEGQGQPLWTCTVVTTAAADEHAAIHHRTPLLVPPEHWASWLDPEQAAPTELLVPGLPGVLAAWPVGPEVGNVRNHGPELLAPVEPDADPPTLL